MRLRVTHETAYRYGSAAASMTQVLRMTPRGFDGQFVVNWRLEVDRDCRLQSATDAFGNVVHSFALAGPIDALTVVATGEVETENTNGVIRGQIERFPATVFLRDTRLTEADQAIRDFADAVAPAPDRLGLLHSLNHALFERMTFDTSPTNSTTPAAEAFASGRGVCQDYAHIFIAAARHLQIPARYVGGYLFQPEREMQEAGHGWVEALVEGFGWVAFDPANGISPTASYVRAAVGLDYLGAAPVRGSRFGGADETLAVTVRVEDIGQPQPPRGGQSQSQMR